MKIGQIYLYSLILHLGMEHGWILLAKAYFGNASAKQ